MELPQDGRKSLVLRPSGIQASLVILEARTNGQSFQSLGVGMNQTSPSPGNSTQGPI